FDDIDIKVCEAPIRYARVEMAAFESTDVLQYEFLKSLLGNHPKFLAISKMTGAYQGSKALNRNQLVDAFYIWCAESSNLDFLLSTDMKLVRHVNNNHSSSLNVKVVTPIALLMHLQDASGIKIFNVFRWIIWMRKKVKLKSYGGAWGLVHASKKLRKRGYYDE
ncbi:MAG TPA: hypothetical protein VFP95_02785, partial [Gammaproteobacteria bacterium]|nr:hypothetical protein [Gammaproteobacteria bacterium]